MALAILSHHFTAMGAVTVVADATRAIDPLSLSPTWLALAVAAVAVAVLGMSLAGAIADRHLADRAVEVAERFHGLAEATTEALIICDGDVIVDVNSGLERLVGRRQVDLVGRPVLSLFPVANADTVAGDDAGEVVVAGPGGELVACEVSSRTIPHGAGVRTIVSLRDLRERKRAEARIVHLAMHDPLTDLPNRTAFNDRLMTTLAAAQRDERGFAMLCVDFDRFKEINDLFGHAAGDALLCEVAGGCAWWPATCSSPASVGTNSLLSDDGEPASTEGLASKLQACVADDILIHGQALRISLSVGVAIFPNDGADAASLLANADAALYRAKSDGRNAIRFFSSEMDARLRERRALQGDLRQAHGRGELILHYQPQAHYRRRDHRLRSPGTVAPPDARNRSAGDLHPACRRERTDHCNRRVDAPRGLPRGGVLAEAAPGRGQPVAGPVPARRPAGAGPFAFSSKPDCRPDASNSRSPKACSSPTSAALVDILRRLKALGVGIAMDDFGTGYSSLSYLQSFPFDKIKIDRGFISNLDHSVQSEAIVRAVIGLGRGLDLPVVAEGVENEGQLAFLSDERCSEVQGYLIGRPGAIDDYAELVGRVPDGSRTTARPVADLKRA